MILTATSLVSACFWILFNACICTAQNQTLWSFQYELDSATRWLSAISRARVITSQMTNEELNSITYGTLTPCTGQSGSVTRLGWEGLCFGDIGKTDLFSGYATGISIGASWNVELAYQRARFMGAEFRKKGVKVALTPVIEPIGRMALNGRNMEGFGADPSLAGKLSAASVLGLQENVISSVKHFVAYEQETYRLPGTDNNFSVSSNVNDKDMHELYLWAFQDAVAAGAACIMCSYNRINGTYACENDAALNGLLKRELNFPGFVVSDWTGQQSGLPSAKAGLDVAMPGSEYWNQGALATAVTNGSLSHERLQDMATRQLAATFYVFDNVTSSPPNGYGLVSDYLAAHTLVEARDPASKPNLLQQAVEGHVLVKNIKQALPLQKPKLMSLFGYDAHVQALNGPQSGLLGLLWGFSAQGVNITLEEAITIYTGGKTPLPDAATLGTLITAIGSGSSPAGYISDPYSAISQRAYDDDTYLWWNFQSYDPDVSAASQACLVFINEASTEGADRSNLTDAASDMLVQNVASKCNNTIVVIHNAYIRLVDAFYDHPNVTAIVYAHLPGQDSGRALVQVLYGDVAPSGRLPYTVAKNGSDYGPLLGPSVTPASNPQSDFSSPDNFDYRYFQANNISPRFPFGFGLTYTNFTYGNISITSSIQGAPASPPDPSLLIPGGIRSLFDKLATVTVDVTNSGGVDAAEVVQLYIRYPGEKIHVLRGFQKQLIPGGQTRTFNIDLTRRDLSRWDVVSQQWLLPSESSTIMVGASSADIRTMASLGRVDGVGRATPQTEKVDSLLGKLTGGGKSLKAFGV